MNVNFSIVFLFVTLSLTAQNSKTIPGFPNRSTHLNVLPGFSTPPKGYGEVPFWWWTGDTLNTERMIGQLKELRKKGVSGVQVNYSHYDTPGWLSDQEEPKIFSEKWWKVYSTISEACAKMDMGIGLSTYTLDWPRDGHNLFYQLFYCKPQLNAIQLEIGEKWRLKSGERLEKILPEDVFAVHAYQQMEGKLQTGGLDLTADFKKNGGVWQAPNGEWEIWTFRAVHKQGKLNPLLAGCGDTITKYFYQPFQNRNPGKTAQGLNYFFNDELSVGLGKFAWNDDFASEFRRRKGYNLLDVLPAMWIDLGDITPKVRMDYADVRMALMEERYFKPIYNWHNSRGIIFGCDASSRGKDPSEFGDYFRATRWYTAPGHDTPGGNADLIKGKVSSSIANLYQRPRVWLEGYHSLGWGATPERIMYATLENYLYGCTLLNLHGFYYTTYGSFYEWAPPCYHFRMPYWSHMGTFLKYFERLSYLMSQGHMVCDVAVVYPVAPYEAEMNGKMATNTAFDVAKKLMDAGINFEFIDNESLARAVVEDGQLKVKNAGASYRTLIFPNMSTVRWPSIEKAAKFAQNGGKVFSVGTLPLASDHAGLNDPKLSALNDLAFAKNCRLDSTLNLVDVIRNSFVQDVRGIGQTVRSLHRKAGTRDIYLVMDAKPGTVVEFRAKGAVEQWNPWTGKTTPLQVLQETATGTQVVLPLESYEANIVVFTPGKKHVNPLPENLVAVKKINLPNEWTVSFLPTMDNTYGDFRMPVTEENKVIGLEGRLFAWARETKELASSAMLSTINDTDWETKLHGYGTQFYVLGPIPNTINCGKLDAALAKLTNVDPSVPFVFEGKSLAWKPYDFSWRYGKEGDPGHEGYHGLKRSVTNDFICLGNPIKGLNETRYVNETDSGCYYLWSCATVEKVLTADILVSRHLPEDKTHTSPVLIPEAIYVNGNKVADFAEEMELKAGSNPILVRYNQAGRGHFVLRKHGVPIPVKQQPLSMKWYDDKGVIPFDVTAGVRPAEWFRFTTAPGTSAIRIHAFGNVEAWMNGVPMKAEKNGRFVASEVPTAASIVALRIQPESDGLTGGILIPEPVLVETNGSGVMQLGDWSRIGILNNYSGGVRYRTFLQINEHEAKEKLTLDLGKVAGTAEVIVNGQTAGVKVSPPWKQDVSGFLKVGENTIEVLVFNTLSNHYQTMPSRYKGNPISGLLGPVQLQLQSEVKTK